MVFALIILISICFVPLWLESDSNVVSSWLMTYLPNDQTSRLNMKKLMIFYFLWDENFDDVHAQTKSHVRYQLDLEWNEWCYCFLFTIFVLLLPLVRCCWKTVYWRFWNGCLLACTMHTMSCPCEYYLIITWFVWWLVWFHFVEPQNNILFKG